MAEQIADTPAAAGPAETDAPSTTPTDKPATPAAPAADKPADIPAGAPEAKTDDVPAREGDWAGLREKYAKGDEKISKRLARYSSAEAALDALIAAQNRISSGELKAPLAKDATPEQVAAWREENGIPAEPAGYDLAELKLSDGDKPVVDDFLKAMHSKNAPPELVKEAIKWNAEHAAKVQEARYAEDARLKEVGDEVLREQWGSEYKMNKNMILGLLDTAPEGVRDGFLGGRMADGTPIGSDPNVLRWLANMAREVNPTATVVPGSGTNAQQAIESELANLTKMMGDRSKTSEYWHGPQAEKHQARYRELVDVQSKLKR